MEGNDTRLAGLNIYQIRLHRARVISWCLHCVLAEWFPLWAVCGLFPLFYVIWLLIPKFEFGHLSQLVNKRAQGHVDHS